MSNNKANNSPMLESHTYFNSLLSHTVQSGSRIMDNSKLLKDHEEQALQQLRIRNNTKIQVKEYDGFDDCLLENLRQDLSQLNIETTNNLKIEQKKEYELDENNFAIVLDQSNKDLGQLQFSQAIDLGNSEKNEEVRNEGNLFNDTKMVQINEQDNSSEGCDSQRYQHDPKCKWEGDVGIIKQHDARHTNNVNFRREIQLQDPISSPKEDINYKSIVTPVYASIEYILPVPSYSFYDKQPLNISPGEKSVQIDNQQIIRRYHFLTSSSPKLSRETIEWLGTRLNPPKCVMYVLESLFSLLYGVFDQIDYNFFGIVYYTRKQVEIEKILYIQKISARLEHATRQIDPFKAILRKLGASKTKY